MPISRRTTYTANTIIDAAVHNLEHDDYVSGINSNTAELANCVKLTSDQVIGGNKGFSSVPYTAGGDPSTENSLTRKGYVDVLFRNYLTSAAPVYLSPATFSVAHFHVRNSVNDGFISKATNTVVDISTNGLNGCARSSVLPGTVSFTSGSNIATGAGTSFLTDFKVGDVISGSFGAFQIIAISSNTQLTLHVNASSTISLATYHRGGECTNTWYYLYAAGDDNTAGLLLSTRNVSAGDALVDLPFTPSSALAGTVTTTSGSPVVAGVNTTFLTDYQVGDTLVVNGGNQLTIASISSDTNLTATTNATATVSGVSHTRIRGRVRQYAFALRNDVSSNIVPFRVGEGWPFRPKIMYPNAGYALSPYSVLGGGTSTSWYTLGMGSIIPPISRLVDMGFLTTVNSNTGSTGYGYIRETGSGIAGNMVGVAMYVSSTGEYIVDTNLVSNVPCNASQQIDYYVVYSGISLWGWVLGYTITEVN